MKTGGRPWNERTFDVERNTDLWIDDLVVSDHDSPTEISIPIFDLHQPSGVKEWQRVGRVCDDCLEILAFLLEQLSQLVVFFDGVLVLDLYLVSRLFGLFEFWNQSLTPAYSRRSYAFPRLAR